MATNADFIAHLSECLDGFGDIFVKKMFGEYMVYADGKPVYLVCDNTVFVKILPPVTALLGDGAETGLPYPSAKPHYIIDRIEDRAFMQDLTRLLAEIIPVPKKKGNAAK